jgi:hypothetical protein
MDTKLRAKLCAIAKGEAVNDHPSKPRGGERFEYSQPAAYARVDLNGWSDSSSETTTITSATGWSGDMHYVTWTFSNG